MLHNKGNTIPYYCEDFSGYATSLAHEFITMSLHSSFISIHFNYINNQFYNFYYQFTTFESKNMRNYNNLCEYLPKIKMS